MNKFGIVAFALSGLMLAGSAGAESRTGVVCVPKTSADAAKIRYAGNRVQNISNSAATVACDIGPISGTARVLVNDLNGTPGQNVTCTGFYYVLGILSNAGAQTSTGTGYQTFTWNTVNISELWSAECTLPAVTAGGAMSSIEAVY